MSIELPVYVTGIRDDELVTSAPNASQNRGTVMRVKGFYPPSKSGVAKYSPSIISEKLNNIEFFSSMTPEERYSYLLSKAVDNDDLYLNDVPLKVKFIKISGRGFLDKLTEQQINRILAGNPEDPDGYWDIQDIYQAIPRKPGSKARRHTLIFRPNIWTLMYEFKQTREYSGIIIDIDSSQLFGGGAVDQNHTIYVFDMTHKLLPYQDIGIKTRLNTNNTLSIDNLFNLLTQVINISREVFNTIYNTINWYTPALHKSLIQKIIRTGAKNIEYSSVLYPADQVLLISFIALLINPGSFVPDIQRYVSGLESALKRLAVSICEDSAIENYRDLMSLYGGAILAQNIKTWKPTNEYLLRAFQVALESLRSKKMYKYTTRGQTSEITDIDEYSISYVLLAELKSFSTDIRMLGSIWENQGATRDYIPNEMITTMPLVHAVDQHSFTEIVYYYDQVSTSYSDLFRNIWKFSSGVNPRNENYKDRYLTMEQNPFVQETRKAQTLLYYAKLLAVPEFKVGQERPNLEDKIPVRYILDESWIAGLIGPIEVRVSTGTAIITLRADNIYDMIAIKKPARGAKEMPELTENERRVALNKVESMLTQGIVIKDAPKSMPWFQNSVIIFHEDEYYVKLGGNIHSLSNVLNTYAEFPGHQPIELTIENSIITYGNGIEINSNETLIKYLEKTDNKVLKRLLLYLAGYKSSLMLYKISRDGKGQEFTVMPEDTQVFHILSYLTILYPACLQRDKNSPSKKFTVKYGPLLWLIRDYIRDFVAQRSVISNMKWDLISDKLGRRLWEHQIDSIEKMKDRTLKNKKGHLIWLPVGLGKTLIVLTYVQWLIQNNKMPLYCVYTLPPSAMDSIIKEVEAFDLPYQVLDMRTTNKGKNKTVKERMINLVKHDHMRMGGLDNEMKEKSADLLFIVDEFHKTLNKTIRTSIALEVSRLCRDFVGLSGTIINTGNVTDLILWLEQIVEFEVTEKNFWVAVSAMISKKVHTQVIVNRHEPTAKFTEDQEKEYYSLVSPAIGGTNMRSGVNEFRKAVQICYSACYKYMIELTVAYIQQGDRVMLVAKDKNSQDLFEQMLIQMGLDRSLIFKIASDNPINFLPNDPRGYWVIITTIRLSEGYNLTGARVMIGSVYFSNQATREQLEGRINRIGQPAEQIEIVTVHLGILTHVLEKYNKARNLSEALKGFADEVKMSRAELKAIL